MKDTYCGKICEECIEREKINCFGCEGNCDIGKCCKNRDRESCDGCAFKSSCVILEKAPTMTEYKLKKEKAPFFTKWLTYLFWLVVPNVISNIMTNNTFETNAPGIYFIGNIINIIVVFIYAFILLQLSKEEKLYKNAVICRGITILTAILLLLTDVNSIIIITGIAAIVFMFIGEYYEYKAHSHVLVGIDDVLSEKWNNLWKWYIGVIVTVVFGMFFMIISIFLGALVALAGTIGIIIVSIMKIIYIYRMSKLFEEYC